MQEDAEAAKLKADPDPLEFFGEGEDKQILGDKVEDEVSQQSIDRSYSANSDSTSNL